MRSAGLWQGLPWKQEVSAGSIRGVLGFPVQTYTFTCRLAQQQWRTHEAHPAAVLSNSNRNIWKTWLFDSHAAGDVMDSSPDILRSQGLPRQNFHCSISIAHLFHIFNNKENASRYQFPSWPQTLNELMSNSSTRHKNILLSFFEEEPEIYQKSHSNKKGH